MVITRYMGGREITEQELKKVHLRNPQIMEVVRRVETRLTTVQKISLSTGIADSGNITADVVK